MQRQDLSLVQETASAATEEETKAMNESDTPETDAQVYTDETICEINYEPKGWVKADFARRLERRNKRLVEALRHIERGYGWQGLEASKALDAEQQEEKP